MRFTHYIVRKSAAGKSHCNISYDITAQSQNIENDFCSCLLFKYEHPDVKLQRLGVHFGKYDLKM